MCVVNAVSFISCDQFLGDIAEKWFRLLVSMLPFHSLCLSRSCIVLKRQKISTRFLLHMTAPCLSHITLKFGLHRSTPSFPNFAPKWPIPCWFQHWRVETFAGKLWPCTGHNGERIGNHHCCFEWCHQATTSPSPTMWVPFSYLSCSWPNLCDVCLFSFVVVAFVRLCDDAIVDCFCSVQYPVMSD